MELSEHDDEKSKSPNLATIAQYIALSIPQNYSQASLVKLPDSTEWQDLLAENHHAQQALEFCTQLSSEIEQQEPGPQTVLNKDSMQAMKLKFQSHKEEIKQEIQTIPSYQTQVATELEDLQKSKDSIEKCLKVVSQAEQQVNVFENIHLSGNSSFVAVSTVGEIQARNLTVADGSGKYQENGGVCSDVRAKRYAGFLTTTYHKLRLWWHQEKPHKHGRIEWTSALGKSLYVEVGDVSESDARKLQNRLGNVTGRDRPFRCPQLCEMDLVGFTSRLDPERHMHNCHGESTDDSSPSPLQRELLDESAKSPCPTCLRTFNNRTHLHAPEVIHTSDGQYSCSDCGRAFSDTGDFTKHERAHLERAAETLGSPSSAPAIATPARTHVHSIGPDGRKKVPSELNPATKLQSSFTSGPDRDRLQLSAELKPRFLLLCISTAKSVIYCPIDVTHILNDQLLFQAIRDNYNKIKKSASWVQPFTAVLDKYIPWLVRTGFKGIDLFSPRYAELVSFFLMPVPKGDEETFSPFGIEPSYPPEDEVWAQRWEYRPCPKSFTSLKMSEAFVTTMLEPGHAYRDDAWLDLFPKKLHSELKYQRGEQNVGWGIHISEGINTYGVVQLAFHITIGSGVFGVLYSAISKDTGAGFTIAAWIATTAALFVASAQLRTK